MSAILIYSMRCKHSVQIVDIIQKHKALMNVIRLHDVNTGGVPPQLQGKITSVPVIVTSDGNFMVGKEAKNWVTSMIPENKEVTSMGFGGMGAGIQSLENPDENDQDIFSLDSYGSSLAPQMTPELQQRIDMNVADAYNKAQSK